MRHLLFLGALLLLGSACGVEVQIQTDPISQAIPVTSVGLDTYAEVAVDLPSASAGDITIEELTADLFVNNASKASTMTFSLRLLTNGGQATPSVPVFYTASNKPSYFDQAQVVFPAKSYAPATRTQEHLDVTQLKTILGARRIWLIVGNTISKLGIGEVLPAELRLEDVRLNARVNKSLQSASGGLDLTGL